MRFRNAIKAIFGGIKNFVASAWREVGGFFARFSSFGVDIYANDVVRACIRTLSEHSSKANIKVIRRTEDGIQKGDYKLQQMIQLRPNIYMNGKDFISKVRTLLEIHNTVFIYIMRDDYGRCIGLYPMPNAQWEALDVGGRLYIKFTFSNGTVMAHSWDDLAVLRKDYNTSDIFGDTNDAILTSLDLLHTTNEGMANAIKSTANLRGILKNTKAGLDPKDVAKNRDQFVQDYMTISNSSGVASLDAYQDFTPITMQPQIANYKSVEDLRLNVYRYFGVNEKILTSDYTPEQWQAFYEARIEPFLLALSLELTYKIFTDRERGHGNEIFLESNRMQYMSISDKLSLVQMVDRKALTPNEWRGIMNLAPVEGGDELQSWQNPQGGTNNANKAEQGISGDEPIDAGDGKTD